jgi:sugar phosphate isomerase/epimerase
MVLWHTAGKDDIMDIGINIDAYPIPVSEQLALIKKNGFSAVFCMSGHHAINEITDICAREGITIESCHAPFDHINDIWYDTEDGERMLDELLAAVNECRDYGIPVLVVHLSSGETPPRVCDLGISRFGRLMTHADACGVTVAFENQRMLGNISVAMESFPTAAFCWDCGHESCFTDGRWDFMSLFGDRLCAIHIHDNRATHNADDLRLPFDGEIDFDSVTERLARFGYAKAFMLEVFVGKNEAYRDMGPEAYYARAAAVARHLAETVDTKRP